MEKFGKLGIKKVAFLQALGVLYTTLVGMVIWKGEDIFF